MNRIISLFLTTILALPALAYDLPYSASRTADQDWKIIAKERRAGHRVGKQAAVDMAVDALKADLTSVAKWSDYADIEASFLKVRDERFVQETDKSMPAGYLRRSTWMYPDDGCFARAQLMEDNLTAWGHKPTSKIFVFGNLRVKSKNAIGGSVSWWYHVAPVVSDGMNEYVLDPAIEPSKPLLLNDWLKTMGSLNSLSIAICNTNTYTPYSDCYNPSAWDGSSALDDQRGYLSDERSRLENLGRDTAQELGDYPPWLVLAGTTVPAMP